jgi:hypothetical protein
MANPFETMGLDPLLIAEVKNTRNPEEFKKFLKEFRDQVAMALHPDRMKDIKSTYLPAVLEAYDQIKGLNNGKLDGTVEEFLKSAAKDDSDGMVVKLEQLASIVEKLEEDYNAAQRKVTTLEAERTAAKRKIDDLEERVEEVKSDAGMYRMEGEGLRIDMKRERAEHSRELKSTKHCVDRRGFIKGFGVGIIASLIGYGGGKLLSADRNPKPVAKTQSPKKAVNVPAPKAAPTPRQPAAYDRKQYAEFAADVLIMMPHYNGFGKVAYASTNPRKNFIDYVLKNEKILDDVRTGFAEFSRRFNIPETDIPKYIKQHNLGNEKIVFQGVIDAEPAGFRPHYSKYGSCGTITVTYDAVLLPYLITQDDDRNVVYFDRKAAEALATGKGKMISSWDYEGLYARSHKTYRPLYGMLCDYLGLKPDGGR